MTPADLNKITTAANLTLAAVDRRLSQRVVYLEHAKQLLDAVSDKQRAMRIAQVTTPGSFLPSDWQELRNQLNEAQGRLRLVLDGVRVPAGYSE